MGPESRGLLIDTSALVAHFRGQARIDGIVGRYPAVYVSAVTVYELEYGALRVGRASDLADLEAGFAMEVVPLGREEALRAAELNAALASQGRRIGDRDALIAGTALCHGLDLLTLNVGEFGRVLGLRVVAPSANSA